jgi:hypothetical protein
MEDGMGLPESHEQFKGVGRSDGLSGGENEVVILPILFHSPIRLTSVSLHEQLHSICADTRLTYIHSYHFRHPHILPASFGRQTSASS